MKPFLASLLVCAALAGVSAAQTKYGAKANAEKNVDFAALKTYAWTKGQPSSDKAVDGFVVAAVDRELAALGLAKAAEGKSDVLVTYYAQRRTDVNVDAKPDASGVRPQQAVGVLVVGLLDPASRKPLLRLRTDKPVDTNPATAEQTIGSAVSELFALYPTRRKK